MIGDTIVNDGTEFEVVWAGGEGLVPDRATKPGPFWVAPRRMYNKKSESWKKTNQSKGVDNPVDDMETTQDDNQNERGDEHGI